MSKMFWALPFPPNGLIKTSIFFGRLRISIKISISLANREKLTSQRGEYDILPIVALGFMVEGDGQLLESPLVFVLLIDKIKVEGRLGGNGVFRRQTGNSSPDLDPIRQDSQQLIQPINHPMFSRRTKQHFKTISNRIDYSRSWNSKTFNSRSKTIRCCLPCGEVTWAMSRPVSPGILDRCE